MGTDKELGRKQRTRLVKGPSERRRREKVQKKRLIALGVAAERVEKMTTKEVRDLLKRPKTVQRSLLGRA